MIEVLAPGKVVLLGEYAVVDGAPALVAAVDSGVRCVAEAGPTLRIEAPDERFVGPALADAPRGTYTFSAWNPPATETKAGLGTSAAATVAAVLAARTLAGEAEDPAAVQRVATEVHRAVQGGGSGIDVAASARGGVLRYTPDATREIPAADLADRLTVVWSGRSAETGPRVERYRRHADRRWFVEASTALADAWERDPVAGFTAALALLRDLDRRVGLGWWVPEYEPIVAHALAHGGAAKPSGAGGGDVVVAVFPSRDQRDAFERTCPTGRVLRVGLAGPARARTLDGT